MLRHSIRFTLTAVLAAMAANHALADTIPNTFASGEVIDAERINENFSFLNSKLRTISKVPANRIYDQMEVEKGFFGSFTNDYGTKIRIEDIGLCGLKIDGIELAHNDGSWKRFVLPIEDGQTVTLRNPTSSTTTVIISYLEDEL